MKVRLVREEMFEERSASARGQFLRAAFENMVGGTTKHTAAETQRVTALEASEWISRKVRREGRRSRLVALHGLLRWGHKRTGRENRGVIGMPRGNRKSSRGKTGSISRRDRGSDRMGDREGSQQSGRKGCVSIFGERCGQLASRGSSEENSDKRQHVRRRAPSCLERSVRLARLGAV